LIDLPKLSTNVEKTADGLWRARSASAISYPDWGNEACFQVEDWSFWFQHRNACILEAMKLFPPEGAVFDIGGGNGFVAKGMQEAGWEVVLVEPGMTGARNAQRRGIRWVVCATLEDAGFLPASLPAVGLFDVVEHVEKEKQFLAMLRELLVPDGKVYLTVPAYNFLWSQEDIDAGHQRRYSRRELRDMFVGAGFKVDFLSGFFQFLPPAIFLARVLPYRLGLAKSPDAHEIPQQMKQQHVPSTKLLGDVLRRLEQREQLRLSKKNEAKFGASWLVVATKR